MHCKLWGSLNYPCSILPWGSTKSVSINIIFILLITMCGGTEVVSKMGKNEELGRKGAPKRWVGLGWGATDRDRARWHGGSEQDRLLVTVRWSEHSCSRITAVPCKLVAPSTLKGKVLIPQHTTWKEFIFGFGIYLGTFIWSWHVSRMQEWMNSISSHKEIW